MDPAGRFSDRADDYVRYRPTYPKAAMDAVLRGLPGPEGLQVADVGAGTGISARLLAERGAWVVAIEPNHAMRQGATPHPRVEWRGRSAESTGLPRASVDLVLCAQAFHWFEGRQALTEFQRILRPRGRLALMWNVRDGRDPLTQGFIDAIHQVNGEHPAERRDLDPVLFPPCGFSPPRLEVFEHAQELDAAGLFGRARSASYVSKDEAKLETLERLLGELFRRHANSGGRVTMRYRTDVHLTAKRPNQETHP